MLKCLNSSPWAASMTALASGSGSTASRCSHHPIASASRRARHRVVGTYVSRAAVRLGARDAGRSPSEDHPAMTVAAGSELGLVFRGAI